DRHPVGWVGLVLETRDARTRIQRYLGISCAVLLTALLAAYLLSSRLQRVISGPIGRLAEAERQISQKKDYSLRVERQSNDELGTLIDGFNDMLDEIQRRDRDLERHRENLEE